MGVNKDYKDRLFRMLFGTEENKGNILSLYNALSGSNYTNEDDIEITTIDDVIYMGMKNDVSFIVDDRMSLWEQQSSFNPNMPVRGLMYYGKMYDSFTARQAASIYGSTLIKLPTPQYVVFYNGSRKRPAIEKMRLSDAFISPCKDGEYEWTATVYYLNSEENSSLLEMCTPLAGYTEVVNRIRERLKPNMTQEDAKKAVDEAVKSCIADGILAEFLTKHRAEVVDVCLTEFDEAKYADTLRNEGRSNMIADMLRDGKTPEEISSFCKIPLEEVKKVQEGLLQMA